MSQISSNYHDEFTIHAWYKNIQILVNKKLLDLLRN